MVVSWTIQPEQTEKQGISCVCIELIEIFCVTCFHGKCFRAAKAMVTAGLRCAPEMCPVERMTIITARPVEAAQPRRVSEPFVFWFTMAVAVPANINMKVPTNSAPTCQHIYIINILGYYSSFSFTFYIKYPSFSH